MKDYGVDVFSQCIDGKVVFFKKPLVFNSDEKPFVNKINISKKPKESVCESFPKVVLDIQKKRYVNEK